jgi:hypothetical protein
MGSRIEKRLVVFAKDVWETHCKEKSSVILGARQFQGGFLFLLFKLAVKEQFPNQVAEWALPITSSGACDLCQQCQCCISLSASQTLHPNSPSSQNLVAPTPAPGIKRATEA